MSLHRRVVLAAVILVLPVSVAAQRTPQDVETLANEGSAALEEKRFGDALEAFAAAVKLAPRDPGLSFGVGLASYMLGQNDQAELVRAEPQADPGYVGSSLMLGELVPPRTHQGSDLHL